MKKQMNPCFRVDCQRGVYFVSRIDDFKILGLCYFAPESEEGILALRDNETCVLTPWWEVDYMHCRPTWKEKFYPVPAKDCVSVIEALDHSILKWEGLGLLEEYGSDFNLAGTCALCMVTTNCKMCPIFDFNSRGCIDEYADFINYDDVEPMQKLLKQTKEHYCAISVR